MVVWELANLTWQRFFFSFNHDDDDCYYDGLNDNYLDDVDSDSVNDVDDDNDDDKDSDVLTIYDMS